MDGGQEVLTIESLLQKYREFCKATAEFERNAITLRANSTALNICRKLASREIPAVIKAYTKVEFRDRKAPPEVDTGALYGDFDPLVAVMAEMCRKLLKELDQIDVVASAESYYQYADYPLLRALPEIEFLKNIHGHPGLGRCHAYLHYVIDELTCPGVKGGLDALMKKQDHYRTSFMDFATVAIFFSSITATTLQFSFMNADTTLAWTAVNVCWFASLILSIASAANSFLGAIVHQSPEYLCQPNTLDRRFLQKWFAYCPPMLLTISGVLFSVGICSFTFSRFPSNSGGSGLDQGRAIQATTNSLALLNFLALIVIFMLAFTKIMQLATHLVIKVMHVIPHLAILSLLFALATLAFIPVTLGYLVVYMEFPKPREYFFWNAKVLGGPWRSVESLFDAQTKKLRDIWSPSRNEDQDNIELEEIVT